MNTEPFSFDAFNRASHSVFSDELALRLGQSVLLELAPVIERAFAQVVSELNEAGHNLQPYQEQNPGQLHYRSSTGSGCDLLLACDVVITSAFRHGIDSHDSNGNRDA